MRITCISDTHSMQAQVIIPITDVLVHAGDLCSMGTRKEIEEAVEWLNLQPAEHIVVIAGNHDFALETKKLGWWADFNWGRVTYLENSGTVINGIKFYGSPVTPFFCNWAFNVNRGPAIKAYWDLIPTDTDVLITHGPQMYTLDQAIPNESDHLGCEELSSRLVTVQPKLHVFGHIHGSYGRTASGSGDGHGLRTTISVNASQVNEAYKVVHHPIEVTIEDRH